MWKQYAEAFAQPQYTMADDYFMWITSYIIRWNNIRYDPHEIIIIMSTPSSSLCNHGVPWLGEGLSMLLLHLPILRYPLPDGTLPVIVYSSSLHRLAGLPLGLFLS